MAPPVVLLHGFGTSSARTWGENGWFDLLADAGREAVGIDLLGHGTAPKPHEPEPYADLEGWVAQQLPPGPVDAVGFSLGARVLLGVAAGYPTMFRRIVTLGGNRSRFRRSPEARRLRGDRASARSPHFFAEGEAMSEAGKVDLAQLLAKSPSNWGRWGDDDEIGCLNYLTPAEVLRGVAHVKQGKVFMLGIPIGNPGGDPVWPGRSGAVRLMTNDRSHYVAGKREAFPGGLEYADDYITAFLQGSTQYDALGHTWYGEEIYNGYDAMTTTAGLSKCGVDKLANRGIVGRGVLIDIARHRGKDSLAVGETFGVDDLEAAAAAQGVTIDPHDNLLIRTGWLKVFYDQGPGAFYGDTFVEPGLVYSPELVEWFCEKEIVSLSTDTIANEVTLDPETGIVLPLHAALMRNLGILFSEICWFEELASDSAADGQWSFLYVGAPLKIVGGTGSPVNPVAVK